MHKAHELMIATAFTSLYCRLFIINSYYILNETFFSTGSTREKETSVETTTSYSNIPVINMTSTFSNLCKVAVIIKNNYVFHATISFIGISAVFFIAYKLTSCFLKNAQKKTSGNIERNVLV